MKINLIDKDNEITRLITPGEVVDDLLGRRARVRLGFAGATYPTDYITVFRGVIDDLVSEPGMIGINIGSPDQKKRNTIFELATTGLNGAINNSVTTLTVDDTTEFLVGITGPDLAVDPAFTAYVKIDDEIISYTGKTATTFTGCTRAQLGTLAAAHDDEAEVSSFYRLTDNGVLLALKLMLSGWAGPFQEDVEITNFERIAGGVDIPNAIYFEGVDVRDEYGIIEGDYVTTTGASNGANNVTLKTITTIIVEDGNSYIVINGVTFVQEIGTAGVVDFRSQYDTLPAGLKMHGDEVDVDQHIIWYGLYLSAFDMDFYLKDTVDGKNMIEKHIYLPMSAYALPRKSRASMGLTVGPSPIDSIANLSEANICNPDKIKIRRQIGKNFYNTIVYRFEQDSLEDKFLFGHVETDATSKARIPVGNKTLIIDAPGMRRSLSGSSLASNAADRLLTRYRYAAEYIEEVQVLFSTGFAIECGDMCILDGENLNITDTSRGDRDFQDRIFEVINKKMNIKDGKVTLHLVDTNLSLTARYCLVSPASQVSSGASTTVFTLASSYGSVYGVNEWRKWRRYEGMQVRVRKNDFTQNETVTLVSVSNTNVVTVSPALTFTPGALHIMELSTYNNSSETLKNFYGFMRNTAPFDDGGDLYQMS